MPTKLQSTLNDLAQNFANGVLEAIRGASLDDLLMEGGTSARRGPGRPRGATPRSSRGRGRLARRTPEQIARVVAQVVSLVKGKKAGLRSEQIRDALKLDRRELPRVLHEGLKTKKLKAKGQKRATVYSAR